MRQHLAKVYGCLSATTAMATAGAYAYIANIYRGDILGAFLALGLGIGLYMWRDNGKNFMGRFGLLLGFGLVSGDSFAPSIALFCHLSHDFHSHVIHLHCPLCIELRYNLCRHSISGNTMGPLLNMAIAVNPQIIVTALVATSLVFVSFTAAALVAKRGSYMFLGAILMSVLSYMSLFSIANIFMRSQVIYQGQLYVGLIAMSAFILYDTQAIMEKYRIGNRDPITHSLDLFFDIASIFQRLVIILTQKEQREKRRKRN